MSEFDLVLPTTVDVREVGMRDGLQMEAPVPLDAKLAMLEDHGVSFSSPGS